nr:helix-turn-helix domain-containing protein [uncultured Moraxella sp.]
MQKYLNSTEICEMFKISKRTLNRWHKNTQYGIPFPKPCLPSAGGGKNLYLSSEVEAWEIQCYNLKR